MNQTGSKEKLDVLAAEAVRARTAGDLAAAEQLYLRILGLVPDHQGVLHDLGVIATVSGRLPQAVEWYERALCVSPSADTHSNLGAVLQDLGDFSRARHHLAEAIRLRPDYAVAHCNMGALLMTVSDGEGAHAHFLRAAELEPGDAVAWLNAARALLLARQPQAALAPLERALALAPESTDARALLGSALILLGRLGQAAALLETVREERPDQVEWLADRAHVRQQLCLWQGLNEDAAEIRLRVTDADRCAVSPFYFAVLPGTTAIEQRLCAEKYRAGPIPGAGPASLRSRGEP